MSYTAVQNRFWSDGWIRQLNALDRYLFLYLLTNGRGSRTGIYELPLDLMASESGIDEKDLKMSMLQRLEPKVYYKEGWVILINYTKHLLGDGPKFWSGVSSDFNEIPPKIRELAIGYGYPINRLSIGYSRFSNRIEQNRRGVSVKTPLPGGLEIQPETIDGREKKKREPRNMEAWRLREELYDKFEEVLGIKPTPNGGDYMRIVAALKSLRAKDIKTMVDDALAVGSAETVRGVLTDRKVDLFRRENI